MAKRLMTIEVADEQVVNNWTGLEDVLADYTEAEILEIVGRYMDAQRHAVNYRQSAKGKETARRAYETQKVKTQMMKSRLAELEARLKSEENGGGGQ